MAPKVKVALRVMSEAVETMCGWAFCVVALYAVLFMNLTGRGCLWDSLRGVLQDTTMTSPLRGGVPVVMRVVPVRPPDLEARAQNHMLMIPEAPEKEIAVPVVAAVQPSRAPDRVVAALAPAPAKTTKDWRAHLTSRLKTFTVYGQGDQHASAGASVRGAAAAPAKSGGASAPAVQVAAIASAPTPAKAGSAYQVGAMTGEARPGISDHISNEDANAGDGVRNFR